MGVSESSQYFNKEVSVLVCAIKDGPVEVIETGRIEVVAESQETDTKESRGSTMNLSTSEGQTASLKSSEVMQCFVFIMFLLVQIRGYNIF